MEYSFYRDNTTVFDISEDMNQKIIDEILSMNEDNEELCKANMSEIIGDSLQDHNFNENCSFDICRTVKLWQCYSVNYSAIFDPIEPDLSGITNVVLCARRGANVAGGIMEISEDNITSYFIFKEKTVLVFPGNSRGKLHPLTGNGEFITVVFQFINGEIFENINSIPILTY